MSEAVDRQLPWHRENWRLMQSALNAGRLPHALLITGSEGLGKGLFARRLAHSLLCQRRSEEGTPCGDCHNCRLFRAGTHPDFKQLVPPEPGKAIRIDVIREYIGKEALTAQAGGYKVVILEPADALNTAAANSLLKTLEEPVAWTVMLLVTANPSRLPATIRSRCQRLHFTAPDRATAAEWLQRRLPGADTGLLLALSTNAPLRALALADEQLQAERHRLLDEFLAIIHGRQDPVLAAARWNTQELPQVLIWLSGWITDMIRLKLAPDGAEVINPDRKEQLQALAAGLSPVRLYRLLDRVYEAIGSMHSQLNTQMQLEDILLLWAEHAEGMKHD